MQTESKQQILERRKEIERELSDMLKETESDFSLQDVKDAIYREQDREDFHKLMAMFDRGGNLYIARKKAESAATLRQLLKIRQRNMGRFLKLGGRKIL